MADKKSEIRIYPQFTEVREDVKATSPYHVYLPQDLFNQIMTGSLSLEKVKVLSMNSVLKDTNLEGKILHVHREKAVKQVKVIRGRDMLVQDLETERYFNVNREQLEFTDVPEESGTEVTFMLEKEGDAVLSYLMYGINWKPRYILNVESSKHDFQGWADINNNTQREYNIEKTELFGGDVSLSRPKAGYGGGGYAAKKSANSYAIQINSEGEKSGLYMYSINDKFVLAPRSTLSLPLLSPNIKLEKLSLLTSYFCQSNSKGKFSRVYRISSDEFLPSGSCIVREDGRVVGQATIPDLGVGDTNDLNVGNDPDVSYEREANSLEILNESTKYEVTVKITNGKNREVKVEFTESIGQRHDIVLMEPDMKFSNDTLKYEANLAAGETATIKYLVLIHFN